MQIAGVRLLGLIALVLLLSGALNYGGAKAQTNPYPWVAGTPTLQKEKTYSVDASTPAPANIAGNDPDCYKQSFTYKPEINGLVNRQAAAAIDVCAYKTSSGWVSTSGWALLNGTKTAGPLTGPAGTNGIPWLIPNSDKIIEFINVQGEQTMKIIDDAYSGLQVTKAADSSITYKVTKASPLLRGKDNRYITVMPGTMSFSESGDWLVIDAPGTGLMRINLTTHEVMPFAQGFTYGGGSSPTPQTAISNDGRYAVVASSPNSYFKIYDLSSCTAPASGSIYSCKSRDLQAYLKSAVPTLHSSAERIRFTTNDTFNFYADYDYVSSTNRKVGFFSLTTPEKTVSKVDYLAMGDSFASGEGAGSYRSGTDMPDNRCHESELAYPYLLDAALGTGVFKTVACSGARIKDITMTDLDDYNHSDPQAHGKITKIDDDEIFNNYLPGYRAQLNFVTNNSPNIVTISTVGNDIGFSKILQSCVLGPDTCYYNYEERLEIVRRINKTYDNLVGMYGSIKKASAIDAKIYVIGYPQIADPNGNCGANVHFDKYELLFGKQLITYLNTVVKMAADNAGVSYVDTEQAFFGHRLCEATYSNIAVNGLTNGNDSLFGVGPFSSGSYHPNEMGHRKFASTILNATNGFTLANPIPTTGGPVFPAESSLDFLKAVTPTNREAWDTNYDEKISPDLVYINQSTSIKTLATDYNLKPNTNYGLSVYSTPTDLGTVTSDIKGEINANFTIPASLEPGYHTLHIRGDNIIGDKIDIQKIIYVAASPDDYDGDGILNSVDKCTGVPESGLDTDADGIDDACDGNITEPPVAIPVTPPEVIVPAPTTEPTTDPQPIQPNSLPDTTNPQLDILPNVGLVSPTAKPKPTVVVKPPTEVVIAPSQSSDEQNTPTTIVAGAKSDAPKTDKVADVAPTPTKQQSRLLIALLVMFGVGGAGAIIGVTKLAKNRA